MAKRRLVGLVAALLGLATVLALAGWGGGPSRPVDLASLDASPSHTLQNVYQEDERRGMKILQAMEGKAESPMLVKLMKSKRMRGVLAAAIGSARSQESGDGGNLAFELGNIASSQHLAAAPRAAPHRIQQMRQKHAAATTRFAAPKPAASKPAAAAFMKKFAEDSGSSAAPHRIQLMRQRYAAVIDRAAATKSAAPKPVAAYVEKEAAEDSGSYEYSAFAPGVLPGTTAPKAKPVKETAKQKLTDAERAKVLVGVETATGFSDETVASVPHSREAKLEAEVKALRKSGAAQKAQLTAEKEKGVAAEAAETAKGVALAKQTADKAAMLAKVKAKARKTQADAKAAAAKTPAGKAAAAKVKAAAAAAAAAAAKAEGDKEAAAAKAAQQVRPPPLNPTS